MPTPLISLSALGFGLLALCIVWWVLGAEAQFKCRRLQLMRILIPSWRFFDEAGDPSVLEIQVDGGPWIDALPRAPRAWHSGVFNPEGNLRFAEHSLLEQFTSDLAETPVEELYLFEQSVSFDLVARLARHRLPLAARQFAFRVRATEQVLWVSRTVQVLQQ